MEGGGTQINTDPSAMLSRYKPSEEQKKMVNPRLGHCRVAMGWRGPSQSHAGALSGSDGLKGPRSIPGWGIAGRRWALGPKPIPGWGIAGWRWAEGAPVNPRLGHCRVPSS